MDLSAADRDALIHHLAERLPAFADRARVARDAGVGDAQLTGDPDTAWADVVREAVEKERLAALLAAAARTLPTDAVLAELARTAEAGRVEVPPVDDPRSWLMGAAVAGVVVVILGAVALGLDVVQGSGPAVGPTTEPTEASTSVEAPPEVPVAAEDPSVPVPEEPIAGVADDAPAPADAPADEVGDPALDELVPDDVEIVPDDDAPAVASAPGVPCAEPAGQVVGYAYAGKGSPGRAGGTWTVPRGLNVRADYPRRDNGWNARTRVTCVLPRGARVTLEQAPVAVDGSAFWVPIVGGSVRTR